MTSVSNENNSRREAMEQLRGLIEVVVNRQLCNVKVLVIRSGLMDDILSD